MERKLIPVSEQKLLILGALRGLGGVTQLQLLRFMVEEDLMNYFSLQLSLYELEDAGYVSLRHHVSGSLYELTDAGRYALESFGNRVPISRRKTLEEGAKRWKDVFRLEKQNQAEAFPLKDGRQCLRLRLLEGDSALMDLSLTLHGRLSAEQLKARWQNAAQDMYTTVTSALNEGFREGERVADVSEAQTALPETVLLQQVREGEWMLSLTDSLSAPTINLILSLPTEALARYDGLRWPLVHEKLTQKLFSALLGNANGMRSGEHSPKC